MKSPFEDDIDIAVSTRIRLARNLTSFPFPNRLSLEGCEKVKGIIKDAILKGNSAIAKDFSYFDMDKITKGQSLSFVEKHLISPDFTTNRKGRGLLIVQKELESTLVSIMINEEDHVRLQVLEYGLNFNNAYDIASKIDKLLDDQVSFAFDEKLGYLTQCPTNLGTGMRASVMLHLPVLQRKGLMNRVASNLAKLGLTVRGTYGEGTQAESALYQISNQVTLGLSEHDTIKNLKDVTAQIILQERNMRKDLASDIKTIDAIQRSQGILANARILSSDEFMSLISNVRLGVSIGEIKTISIKSINQLIGDVQPATIEEIAKKPMDQRQRDIQRAEIVRSKFIS